MRVKYRDVFVDGNGRVLSGGTVTVYLGGTSTPATIYATEAGGAIAGSSVTTDTDGSFSFWIDSADYTATPRFKLVLTKTGYVTATYDDVFLYWLTSSPVNSQEICHYHGGGKTYSNELVFVYTTVNSFSIPAAGVGSYATA